MSELQLPDPPQDEGALLTIEAAARKLRVSSRYVSRLIADGSLPVIWLGQKTKRIDPADLTKLLKTKTLPPGHATPPDYKPPNGRDMSAARAVLLRNRKERQSKVNTIDTLPEPVEDDLVL